MGRLPAGAGPAVPQLRGRQRRPDGQQPGLDRAAERDRLPARDRQALPRRHDAQEGRRRVAPRAPTRASATRSSATRSCRAWTTSSCSATTAACCRPAAPTSGATSPAAPNSSASVEGKHVHALGTPLITNSDGTKFGKSEGNAIWLDPAMCSPYALLPVLAQHGGRRRRGPPQGLHVPEPRRDRGPGGRPSPSGRSPAKASGSWPTR